MTSEHIAGGNAFALPADRLERRMPDYHPALSEAQAVAEANRCLYCHDAPCIAACPTRIDIPEFIRKISTRNYRSSARTILDSNILGLSCARVCPVDVLCAGACVYNHMDRPAIEIGRLQRFATEWAYDRKVRFFERGAPNGRKVACVGGGPASLACAAELAILGYAVTILEGRELPGGLNTTGVAPYKLYARLGDARDVRNARARLRCDLPRRGSRPRQQASRAGRGRRGCPRRSGPH
jgi:glutamate synthase (NADPH/NADH) small chain